MVQPLAPYGMRRPSEPHSTAQASCDADRMVPAGGALADRLLHPSITPFERVFRVLPSEGIHRATRNKPYSFVLGAFTLGLNQGLALCEYRFRPYRFDGVIAGEAVPLEDRRLATSVGYDLTVGVTGRQGNFVAAIIPGAADPLVNVAYPPVNTGGSIFPSLLPTVSPLVAVQSLYGNALIASNVGSNPSIKPPPVNGKQYVTALSAGSSLMPQNQHGVQGSERMPFTYYVNNGDPVTLTVGIFAPVRIPIAFFEGVLSGYILPVNTLKNMLEAVRPCS